MHHNEHSFSFCFFLVLLVAVIFFSFLLLLLFPLPFPLSFFSCFPLPKFHSKGVNGIPTKMHPQNRNSVGRPFLAKGRLGTKTSFAKIWGNVAPTWNTLVYLT